MHDAYLANREVMGKRLAGKDGAEAGLWQFAEKTPVGQKDTGATKRVKR